jgi:hypothetical protein
MKLDAHCWSCTPRRSLHRRPAFPSWSWAGWAGGVDYNLLKQYFGVKERNLGHSFSLEHRSFIRVADPEGGQKTFQELWQHDAKTDALTEVSPILHIDATVFQFHLHQRPGSWNSLFICPCPAGPGSAGPLKDGPIVVFDQNQEPHLPGYKRLVSQKWNGLFLFWIKSAQPYRSTAVAMIRDWPDATKHAERVGLVFIPEAEFDAYPKRRRAVLLG